MVSRPAPRAAHHPTWIGFDLGHFLDGFEVEHRLLPALDELGILADFVVTHEQSGVVPRASAVLRVPDGDPAAVEAARLLHHRFGGTGVVLAPASPDGEPAVIGHAGSAWDCLWAAAMSRDGLAGRCVRFPGQSRLDGVVPVRQILERTAVTRVVASGSGAGSVRPVCDDDVVDTRDGLRPVFDGGRLVLRVVSLPGGVLVPDPLDLLPRYPAALS